ncbi:DUF4362 domain-containing protein [Ectobacillus antri]|jgi:hypothetical protein|uniref:DUF4362 domain-containing protein n=1 Tax=Ectobacillus antri TaxID=2486280 RepID=A0ABT6HBB3_9BACI|nr:DUF4362 domain-containing protein [Ectobacillus antri]MDG4658622.1 DUF4362 domain-containing protein [Ectobacillus antri]MDG5755646.1 DUF4362 domain-containing protein [Ectobacillus antri]
MKTFVHNYILFFTCLLIFNLVGCSEKNNQTKEYTFAVSKEKGDVIEKGGKVYNIEELDKFIEKYNTNKGGSVRVTKFNDKEEPTIIDLTVKKDVDSTSIYYDVDYTRTSDKDGQDKNLQYSNTTCKKIKKEIHSDTTLYQLECPEIITLIKIPKE